MERRNHVYAHTQASARLVEGINYDKSIMVMKVVPSLNKAETSMLKGMIKNWINYLEINRD